MLLPILRMFLQNSKHDVNRGASCKEVTDHNAQCIRQSPLNGYHRMSPRTPDGMHGSYQVDYAVKQQHDQLQHDGRSLWFTTHLPLAILHHTLPRKTCQTLQNPVKNVLVDGKRQLTRFKSSAVRYCQGVLEQAKYVYVKQSHTTGGRLHELKPRWHTCVV